MDNSGKIIIKNENNESIECDVLFTFDNNETKKSIYVNAINEYVNLIDNFLPICDKSYGLTSNYRNFIKNNDFI